MPRRHKKLRGGACIDKDFASQDDIDPTYEIHIGPNCFDVRSLRRWIEMEIADHKVPTNPFNRQPLSSEQLDMIREKLFVLGLLEEAAPVNEMRSAFPAGTTAERRNEIFDAVYAILVKFGLMDEFGTYDYDEAFGNWDQNENPLVYLDARNLCENLDSQRETMRCLRDLDRVPFP